jgi:transmembrane sensor
MNGDDPRHPLDWPEYSGTANRVLDRVDAKVRDRKRRGYRRRLTIACAGAFAVAGFAWHLISSQNVTISPALQSSVVVSVPTYRTLPDGSVVDLRDGAKIAVNFTPGIRYVILEHGEAHFQVAKNPRRPFLVLVNGVEVLAVGTAFTVQLNNADVNVLVDEGRVMVDQIVPTGGAVSITGQPLPARSSPTFVGAYNGLVVPVGPQSGEVRSDAKVFPVSEAELNERLAWRVPRLEFSSTPLAEALPMITKFSNVRLVLGEPELGKVQLSGVLRANNLDTLLLLLATDYGIVAEHRSDGEIVLRRRQ